MTRSCKQPRACRGAVLSCSVWQQRSRAWSWPMALEKQRVASLEPLHGSRIWADSHQCLHGDEGLVAAHFQLKFTVKGRKSSLLSEQTMSPGGSSCYSPSWRVLWGFSDPLGQPGTPLLCPSAFHQGKRLTTTSHSLAEKEREKEQRTWGEGEGLCCLPPSCRLDQRGLEVGRISGGSGGS